MSSDALPQVEVTGSGAVVSPAVAASSEAASGAAFAASGPEPSVPAQAGCGHDHGDPEAAVSTGQAYPAVPGPYQPWLKTLGGDLASIVVWVSAATFVAQALPVPSPKTVIPLLGALAALWGVGVERGKARRAGWALSLGLAVFAGAVHAGVALSMPGDVNAGPLPLWGRLLLIVGLGTFVPRGTSRLDRRETGWRRAMRSGPASGATPLSYGIAGWRPPTPVAWALLLLLPLDLALRALSLLAILTYQLTFSRLMPSGCRYEPSCSRYGFQAYAQHSFLRAGLLTSWRILRCSPLGSGGYDPMPPAAPLLPGAPTSTSSPGAGS